MMLKLWFRRRHVLSRQGRGKVEVKPYGAVGRSMLSLEMAAAERGESELSIGPVGQEWWRLSRQVVWTAGMH